MQLNASRNLFCIKKHILGVRKYSIHWKIFEIKNNLLKKYIYYCLFLINTLKFEDFIFVNIFTTKIITYYFMYKI